MTTGSVCNKRDFNVLSIDPGFRNMAYSWFQVTDNQPILIDTDTHDFMRNGITWANCIGTHFVEFVNDLHRWLENIIVSHAKINPLYLVIEKQDTKKCVAISSVIISNFIDNYFNEGVILVFPQPVGQYFNLNGKGRNNKKKMTKELIDSKYFPEAKDVYITHDQYDTCMNFIYFLERKKDFKNIVIKKI